MTETKQRVDDDDDVVVVFTDYDGRVVRTIRRPAPREENEAECRE